MRTRTWSTTQHIRKQPKKRGQPGFPREPRIRSRVPTFCTTTIVRRKTRGKSAHAHVITSWLPVRAAFGDVTSGQDRWRHFQLCMRSGQILWILHKYYFVHTHILLMIKSKCTLVLFSECYYTTKTYLHLKTCTCIEDLSWHLKFILHYILIFLISAVRSWLPNTTQITGYTVFDHNHNSNTCSLPSFVIKA